MWTALFERACFYRAFEDALALESKEGNTPGLLHLSNGAELLHAGLSLRLMPGLDSLTCSHRCHTLALAGGADPVAVAAEIMGLAGGLCGGLAGTQHLASFGAGDVFLTATGIVGSQVPLAAGAALAVTYRKETQGKGVAVAVMGEGAANQGAVLETMNLAAVQHLPLLIIVENNGIAQTTTQAQSTAGTLVGRARAQSFAATSVSVQDMRTLMLQLDHMLKWARSGSGPALLEVMLPRLSGHYSGAAGLAGGDTQAADPLASFAKFLALIGENTSVLDNIREQAVVRAHACTADARTRSVAPGLSVGAAAIDAWQADLSAWQPCDFNE